jgi:hypothetical protein
MSEDEIIKMYEEMEAFFGALPNFEHHPIQFAHHVRVFKYYKGRQDASTAIGVTDYT